MKKALLCVTLALALAACGAMPTAVPRNTGPLFTPTTTRKPRIPRPTKTPEQAETPPPESSPTTLPFRVASPQPTPTVHATLPFSIITSTPTVSLASPPPTQPAARELDCLLVWQSPPSVATYFVEEKFSVGWNIRNTGTVTWEPGTFEFTYLAGTKLATHDSLIPLRESVPPGQEIVLSVPMKAPLHPNMYTTHWGIKTGNTYFCRLTLTILVEE